MDHLIFLSPITGSNLSPYPTAYLLPYNIQSETDYESERGTGAARLPQAGAGGGIPSSQNGVLMGKVVNKPMNSNISQQIIDSAAEDEEGGMTTGQEDEEEEDDGIPSYGFPSQPRARNRCEAPDIDQLISDGGKKMGVLILARE